MGSNRVINMGVPALIGVCQQSSTPPATPSIAITTVTFETKSYGTTLADLTPIGVSDQITTILNAGNSFTVPTDGLAQYYSGSNTSQQVFHVMTVGYTATNFVETDLPADGACQFAFQTNLANTPANSQLNTWPLQGNVEGAFLPDSSKTDGVTITTTASLNRSDVFLISPLVGYTNVTLQNGVQVMSGGSAVEVNGTSELTGITFAAQNLGSSSSFDLVIKLKLGDGSTVESPAQTITVPAGAVKTNLVAGLGINSYTTSTVAHGIQLGVDVTPIDPSQVLVSALNTANSFTTPNLGVGVGMAQGFSDPSQQVLHSWLLNLDTSPLTLADYPATSLIVEYVFSWDAAATEIDPAQAICWEAETGAPSTVTGACG